MEELLSKPAIWLGLNYPNQRKSEWAGAEKTILPVNEPHELKELATATTTMYT